MNTFEERHPGSSRLQHTRKFGLNHNVSTSKTSAVRTWTEDSLRVRRTNSIATILSYIDAWVIRMRMYMKCPTYVARMYVHGWVTWCFGIVNT